MEENQHQSEPSIIAERDDISSPPAKRVKRSAALKSENTWKNIIYDDGNVANEGNANEGLHKETKVDVEQKANNASSVAKTTRRKSTKSKGRQKKTEEMNVSTSNDNNHGDLKSNNNGKLKSNTEEKMSNTGDKFISTELACNVEEKPPTSVKRKGRGAVGSKTTKHPNVLVVKPPSKLKDVSSDSNLDLIQSKTFNITPDMKQNLLPPSNSRHVITVTNSNFSVVNSSQMNATNQILKNKISQIINKHGTKILSGQSLFEANKVLDEMCSTIEQLIEENKANIANAEKLEKSFKSTIQLKDTKINSLVRRVTTLEAELAKINRQKQLDVLENLSMYNNGGNEICENSVSVTSHGVNNEYTVPSIHGTSQGVSNPISNFSSAYNMDDSLLADRHMLSSNNDSFVLSKPPQRHGSRVSGQDLSYYSSAGNSYQPTAYSTGYTINTLEMERDIMPLSANPINMTPVQQGIRSERSVIEKNGVTYQDL